MSNRGRTFEVEVRRAKGAGYASKPGDARRSGRVAPGPAGIGSIRIEWVDTGAAIEARLGVVTVAAVTHDVTSKGWFWAVYLPGMPSVPRHARDSEAAERAILHKVQEWCEAAKLISARRA